MYQDWSGIDDDEYIDADFLIPEAICSDWDGLDDKYKRKW